MLPTAAAGTTAPRINMAMVARRSVEPEMAQWEELGNVEEEAAQSVGDSGRRLCGGVADTMREALRIACSGLFNHASFWTKVIILYSMEPVTQ